MPRYVTAVVLVLLLFSASDLSARGDEPEEVVDLFDMSIEELLEINIDTGKPGWFGGQLDQLKSQSYVHGYAAAIYRDLDLNRGRSVSTFDLHYFNVVVGTRVGDRIAAEVLLEYEHGGDDIHVRYGIIDYRIANVTMLRLGKFLVPMGRFNDFLSPEYENKLPDRPRCLWNIVPIVWAETGVQLRYEYGLGQERAINYAFYIVNGLEQAANSDGTVGEGGDIRKMRQNNRDSNHDNKSLGGRIGFRLIEELELGASYYTGAYTIDGKQDLSIMDLDGQYMGKALTVRGEYVQAIQETTSGNLHKHGFYAEAAYRVTRLFEPVVRYGQADFDDSSGHRTRRTTVGMVFYPIPEINPKLNFKISQGFIHDDGSGNEETEFVAQCVIAL